MKKTNNFKIHPVYVSEPDVARLLILLIAILAMSSLLIIYVLDINYMTIGFTAIIVILISLPFIYLTKGVIIFPNDSIIIYYPLRLKPCNRVIIRKNIKIVKIKDVGTLKLKYYSSGILRSEVLRWNIKYINRFNHYLLKNHGLEISNLRC